MSSRSDPTSPTVSVMVVWPMVRSAESLGVSVEALLSRAGVSADALKDRRARLPIERELALWRAAEELSGEPSFGLRIAKHFEPGVLGSLGYLLRHSEDLPALVRRAQRYTRLVDDLADVTIVVAGDEAQLRFARRGGYPTPPAGVESLFAIAFATGHAMWPTARARAVRFAHGLRGDLAPYRQRFGCRVEFGADTNAIVFDASWVNAPAQNTDPKLARLLEAHAEHLLTQLPVAQGTLELARVALRAALGNGDASPEALARALHVSDRTLRRRLQHEGTSYQTLLDEARHALALTLVTRTDVSLAQVAEQLGFADVSTFYRAFKRWTGMTPGAWQRRGE